MFNSKKSNFKNKKEKKNYDSDDEKGGGNRRKRRQNKFKNNKDKNKNYQSTEKEENQNSGKLKTYIDEKGRKKYDLSGVNIAEYNENKSLALNEEKKLLKFPPADERTFLKGRDESEIVNVDKIVGQSFSLGKVKTEGNLNQRNQKIIDDKINAMGLVQVPQDKDLHNGDVFFCKICECVLKDNAAYIEHLNGKKRKCFNYIDFFTLFIYLDNRMLGMNMKVEKVGIDRVKQKLLNLKRKPEKKEEVTEEDLERRFEELERQAEEERLNKQNKNSNRNLNFNSNNNFN